MSSCVPRSQDILGRALVSDVRRDGVTFLHLDGSFDEEDGETDFQVPFDVTVEHPDAGVVGDDAECDGVHGGDLDGVAAHGVGLGFVERGVQGGVVGGVVL